MAESMYSPSSGLEFGHTGTQSRDTGCGTANQSTVLIPVPDNSIPAIGQTSIYGMDTAEEGRVVAASEIATITHGGRQGAGRYHHRRESWDSRQVEIRCLYIEEKRTLDQVILVMETRGFAATSVFTALLIDHVGD